MCFIFIFFLYFLKCFIRRLEWLLKNNYLPERFPRNVPKIIWKHTNVFVIYSGRLDYKRWIRPWNCHRCPFCTLPLTIIGCKIAKSTVGGRNIRFSKMCISVWNVARISYEYTIKYIYIIRKIIAKKNNQYSRLPSYSLLLFSRIKEYRIRCSLSVRSICVVIIVNPIS